MNRNRWCLIALSALTPISLQLHATGDTIATITALDGTRIEIFAGTGEYAFITRGCNGAVLNERPVSFRDAGVVLEQGLGSTGLAVGVRGGWMRDDIAGFVETYRDPYGGVVPGASSERLQIENRYVNPYFTFERPRGSVGLGWVWHDKEFITSGEGARVQPDHPLNDFSGHVRIGSERRYFALRWMEGVPIYSSGGYLQLGLGGHPGGGPWSLYGGMGAGGPFEGAGLMMQGGYRFSSGITANARTRLGVSGSKNASGVAIGVGYGTPRP